ncbi:MAG: hypothetical protein JO121_12340 [Deltaproteobacteria bacterium]|jgi:hypothetical protein|nr:hypothetical protein [Deltaproteobacteria bacterium]
MAEPKDKSASGQQILFLGDVSGSKPGEFVQHAGTGVIGKLTGKTGAQLKEELASLFEGMAPFLESGSMAQAQGFQLDEVEFSLALSAEGNWFFIAKAGVEGGIKFTWKKGR